MRSIHTTSYRRRPKTKTKIKTVKIALTFRPWTVFQLFESSAAFVRVSDVRKRFPGFRKREFRASVVQYAATPRGRGPPPFRHLRSFAIGRPSRDERRKTRRESFLSVVTGRACHAFFPANRRHPPRSRFFYPIHASRPQRNDRKTASPYPTTAYRMTRRTTIIIYFGQNRD